jgi:hypothetical protein
MGVPRGVAEARARRDRRVVWKSILTEVIGKDGVLVGNVMRGLLVFFPGLTFPSSCLYTPPSLPCVESISRTLSTAYSSILHGPNGSAHRQRILTIAHNYHRCSSERTKYFRQALYPSVSTKQAAPPLHPVCCPIFAHCATRYLISLPR